MPPANTPHDAYPLSPHHAAVVDGAHVTLRWEPDENAEQYAVEIAEDPEFHRIVFSQEVPPDVTDLVVPTPFPDDDRTLYWRVSTEVAGAWSEGARIESFTSGTASQVGHFPVPNDQEPFGPVPSLLWSLRRRRR